MIDRERRFTRPIYRSLGHFWRDFSYIIGHRQELRSTFRNGILSPPFRERLMLAVTGVNDCPYCSWQHTRSGLQKGLTMEEMRAYLGGEFDGAPSDEVQALLYAQHWAEQKGQPDPELKKRIEESYGTRKARAIELALRMIQMGNLMGNTWDYLLYRVSFGRWGRSDGRLP